jgi:hypothetical protein
MIAPTKEGIASLDFFSKSQGLNPFVPHGFDPLLDSKG